LNSFIAEEANLEFFREFPASVRAAR
jgi:hypothetical protein